MVVRHNCSPSIFEKIKYLFKDDDDKITDNDNFYRN